MTGDAVDPATGSVLSSDRTPEARAEQRLRCAFDKEST
jgi:hypothetical protein